MRRTTFPAISLLLLLTAGGACTSEFDSASSPDAASDGGETGGTGSASTGGDTRPGEDADSPGADADGGTGWEPSERFYERVGRTDPSYERREFVPGLGVRITYDVSSYRVLSGRHVQVRVRSRRFFEDPKLAVATASGLEPEFLRAAGIQGGFEWIWRLPSVPAGQHRLALRDSPGSGAPTATAPLFVYPYDERDAHLTNASFERGTSGAPTAWTKWQNTSGDHKGASLGFRATQQGSTEVVHGARSVTLTSSYATHRAGLRQNLQVDPGKVGCRATFSVSTIAWSIEEDDQSTDEYCGDGSFRVLAGLDPSGGTDPSSGAVEWSDRWDPCPEFDRLHVTATLQKPTVTVYLKSAPKWPLKQATSVWDHALLEIDCT